MKGYRKIDGVYIEVGDDVPTSPTLVEVAIRPSADHVFADTWMTNPLDAATCWRLKTASEQADAADSRLQAFLDTNSGKAIKTIVLTGIEKGLWTLAEIKAKHRTL